jgi:hypothetical protein
VFGLIIFYSSQNEDLGEEWLAPESFILLLGFLVMLGGAYLFYKKTIAVKDELPSHVIASTHSLAPAEELVDNKDTESTGSRRSFDRLLNPF